MPVTIELTQDLEARLRREAARQGIDAEAYIARALEQHLQAHSAGGNGATQSTASLPAREAELLQQINTGLPAETWSRYRELLQKGTDGTLTASEQLALVSLSDQIEEANATRLALVAELARLRGVPLEALVRDLRLPGRARA